MKGTNNFFFIPENKAPTTKIKDTTHARIVCTIRETKKEKNRTRMTVGRNNIKYGGVGTLTAHLETSQILFNSASSRPNAKFMTIDVSNFYLMTPIEDYECLRMSVKPTPAEIIEEHGLE